MLTDPGDLVVDPFAGSNVTGEVCEKLGRHWIATDVVEDYLEGSKFRFDEFYLKAFPDANGSRNIFIGERKAGYKGSRSQARP